MLSGGELQFADLVIGFGLQRQRGRGGRGDPSIFQRGAGNGALVDEHGDAGQGETEIGEPADKR